MQQQQTPEQASFPQQQMMPPQMQMPQIPTQGFQFQQQMMSPMQVPQGYSQTPVYSPFHTHSPSTSIASRIHEAEYQKQKDKPLVSVIVTIFSGSSYDSLFRSVPQVAPDGRVSVFQVDPSGLSALMARMKKEKESDNAVINEIAAEIESLDPESVVFNWECCSNWSGKSFGGYSEATMAMIQHALEHKHMVMFSDYALKALIGDWSEKHLGPNPFLNIGEFSDSFDLKFEPSTLKGCASAQLQKVGELCDNGSATVHALGGTIAFTVNHAAKQSNLYSVEIMTVATRLGGMSLGSLNEKTTCVINNDSGAAGHVMLHYASGGKLLVSAGHWIELARLDVSAENLLKVAETSYGGAVSAQIASELSSASDGKARERIVQQYACQFVQQSAPCQYSSGKKGW